MSLFKNMLSSRKFLRHNGQPLWKYDLNDTEFQHLRKSLMEIRTISSIDVRDCALYYAEWWKRYYNGGIPSKRDVFNSILNGQFYDEETFFQQAKKGATLLGIRWIKNQNTLYFKTLLLQGGLPIKHISNNKGAYKNFLLKLLEVNPNDIDDFAFDSTITSLLPSSSRNDEVYECCLYIVKAIINEDKEYLTLLDNNNELSDISSELRIKKQSLNFEHKNTKLRTTWIFEPAKGHIQLHLGIPEMGFEEFRNLFLPNDSDPIADFEYKLYYDNDILCKFIKKANDQYKAIWINHNELIWEGTEQFSTLYIIGSNGNKYNCKHLVSYLPKLNKPTLWTKYSEAQWVLEKGTHTDQQEGFVLFPNEYVQNKVTNETDLKICGKPFKWIAFANTIVLSSQTNQYQFKANSKKIGWYITDERPNWIQTANIPVVQEKPKISVFDESGNFIQNHALKWRQIGDNHWNNWSLQIPQGLIEIQIKVGTVIEYDEFFNIDSLGIKINSNSLHGAEIELVNNPFLFQINESEFIDIEKIGVDKIRLKLKSNIYLPDAIEASLKIQNHSRGLRFKIFPPFKGVDIIDNEQKVVTNGTSLNLGNLYGYRLMSNMSNLVINIYNTKRKNIIISESLTENFIPLRTFEDKINQLYSLSDPMDVEAEIVLEICEENSQIQTKVREYKINRYDHKIEWSLDEYKKLIIKSFPINSDLYAVPIDCSNEQLNLCDLENDNGYYFFKNAPRLDNFVVFCSKESNEKIQPTFISLDSNDDLGTTENRVHRIIDFKNSLLNAAHNEDIWQRFLGYFKICLNNNLSYSTFDILRSTGFSSALAAKCFVFLFCYDNSEKFSEDAYKKMEQDLGFSFHWVNRKHWEEAMGWIGCFEDSELMELVVSAIKFHFENLYPSTFNQTFNYVLRNTKPRISEGYHLNGRITSLRASLGSKVLNELPQKCPKIPELYKDILPVNDTNANVAILLKSPLTIALSISGKDETLWSEENEYIRRNIKYSYQLNPEWYSEAINYCLTRL